MIPLIPLPYAYSALEPHIDTKTMHVHHDRLLKNYVDRLNEFLAGHPEFGAMSLECMIMNAKELEPKDRISLIRYAGGVYNHNLYFALMTPDSDPAKAPVLMKEIDKQFGSFNSFKDQFTQAAMSVFGSGYAWLVSDPNGKLSIITTANQDTPIPDRLCPVILIDVWEHAYFLKYLNLRKDYIENWFQVADWEEAQDLWMNRKCPVC